MEEENPNGCALDAQGRLKDASQIEFVHSPSSETRALDLPQVSSSHATIPSSHMTLRPRNKANIKSKNNGKKKRSNIPIYFKNKHSVQTTMLSHEKRKTRKVPALIGEENSNARDESSAGEEGEIEIDAEDEEFDDDIYAEAAIEDDGSEGVEDEDMEQNIEAKTNVLLGKEEYLVSMRARHEQVRTGARHRDSRTDDIRGIFTPASRTIKANDGSMVTIDGHICNICKLQGESEEASFFKGNNSTMRTHISRASNHFNPYKKKCQQNGIDVHPRAIPKEQKDKYLQTTLDSEKLKTTAPVKWSKDALLDHIIELVIEDDNAFKMVERPSFRRLLQFQRPQTLDKDIPHRTLIREEVVGKAERVTEETKIRLMAAPGQISVTFDTWTSKAGDNYLSFTAHYISWSATHTNDWKIVNEVLALSLLEGGHSGSNQADVLMDVIKCYGITNKIGWLTSDNATVNDRAALHLQDHLRDCNNNIGWEWGQRHIRCMEHATHLAARHFIEAINPTPASVVKRQLAADPKSTVDEDDSDGEEFEPGDVVGKLLAFINQVRKSSDARAYLRSLCAAENTPKIDLATWVRTRWGSLHHCFGVVLKLKPAIDMFVRLADDDTCVPALNKKKYEDYKLSRGEWELIKLMYQVLEKPVNAQMSFSAQDHPTASYAIPVLEFLQTSWEDMLEDPEYKPVYHGLRAGLKNLNKWYRKIDDSNAYFICLVLDPCMKLEYTRQRWDTNWHEDGIRELEKIFDQYYRPHSEPQATSNVQPPTATIPNGGANSWRAANSWMKTAVQTRIQQERVSMNPRQELQHYLDCPLETDCPNVVEWWGNNSKRYPTLARIACDYLAIQGSSTASERLFSSASLTGTNRRNRLTPPAFEAIQVLKSAYNNGFVSVYSDAATREKRMWDDSLMDYDSVTASNVV